MILQYIHGIHTSIIAWIVIQCTILPIIIYF